MLHVIFPGAVFSRFIEKLASVMVGFLLLALGFEGSRERSISRAQVSLSLIQGKGNARVGGLVLLASREDIWNRVNLHASGMHTWKPHWCLYCLPVSGAL